MKPLPPGPTLPAEEQTFFWFSRPLEFLEECRERFGETFTLDFKGLGKHVFFSHPDAVAEIFAGDIATFRGGEGNEILRPFLGDRSLLTLDGAPYMRHRKMMLPAFQPKRIADYAETIRQIAAVAVYDWPREPFNVHAAMLDVSLEVIVAALGVMENSRFDGMKQLLVQLLHAASFSPVASAPGDEASPEWEAWSKFRRGLSELDGLILGEVADERSGKHLARDTVLASLVRARDESGEGFSDRELRDELVTLLIAGHETTATALAWAFWWVLSTPGVAERLAREVAEPWRQSASEKILALPYLDAVVKETLRITPVIPVVSRRLSAEAAVAGVAIPAGTHVVPCIYLAHRRPATYPEPERFRPERFLERTFLPSEFFAFGGGVRRCIGMLFGQAEMKMVLAAAFARYELELAGPANVKAVRRSVVLAPSGGPLIRIKEKR